MHGPEAHMTKEGKVVSFNLHMAKAPSPGASASIIKYLAGGRTPTAMPNVSLFKRADLRGTVGVYFTVKPAKPPKSAVLEGKSEIQTAPKGWKDVPIAWDGIMRDPDASSGPFEPSKGTG